MGKGLEADSFIISNAFDDAGEIVFCGAQIHKTDSHAKPHDVRLTQTGELMRLVNLAEEIGG